MTAGSNHYIEYLLEQLTPLRGAASKKFFGGVAILCDGVQFAMVMDSELYFVVDEATRPNYERMGSNCFSYTTKKGQVAVRKYYTVPAELIEDQDQLVALARESIRVAGNLKSPKTKRTQAARDGSTKRKKPNRAASTRRSSVR